MAARICPQCQTRVDERRAAGSPYCLRCGASLPVASPTFSGKGPAKGGSVLPWILGGIGLFVILGFGGVVVLIVLSSSSDEPRRDPVPQAATAPPVLEPPSSAIADAAPSASARVALKTPIPPPTPQRNPTSVPTPPPPVTVVTVRPTATPAPTPTDVPLGPFPRARAQSEVDRVAAGLASCKTAAGPFGQGTIRIDFEPDGRTGTLSRPPFAGTAEGSCISARFLAIKVGKFAGSTSSIEKAFIIQE